jgi:hypothetical protein
MLVPPTSVVVDKVSNNAVQQPKCAINVKISGFERLLVSRVSFVKVKITSEE